MKSENSLPQIWACIPNLWMNEERFLSIFGAQRKSKMKLLPLAFYLITNGTTVEPERDGITGENIHYRI